jgi:hypothetical protein
MLFLHFFTRVVCDAFFPAEKSFQSHLLGRPKRERRCPRYQREQQTTIRLLTMMMLVMRERRTLETKRSI